MKKMSFLFILIVCHIWTAIYHSKKKKKNHDLVGSEILRIARTTKDMINMVLLINLLSSSFNN